MIVAWIPDHEKHPISPFGAKTRYHSDVRKLDNTTNLKSKKFIISYLNKPPRYATHNRPNIMHIQRTSTHITNVRIYTRTYPQTSKLKIKTPYSSASSTSPHHHPPLHLSTPKNSSSAPPPVSHSSSHPHFRRRCSNWPTGLCTHSRMLYPGDADRALKMIGEGGCWMLCMDLRRMGWRHCAGVAVGVEGRRLRGVAVVVGVAVVMAVGVLVSDLVVVEFVFVLCRRLS